MWIKRARFKNFCCHADLDIVFQCGLIGIVGLNGSGKSSVSNGIYACITNDFSRFPGVKLDNIYSLAESHEESSIEVWLEHNDVEMNIYRGIRHPAPKRHANELNISKECFTRDTDIKDQLRKRLADGRLLDNYVFVDQGAMFSFLTQMPADRAAAYQILCGTQKARLIYDAIDKQLVHDQSAVEEVTDNSDELNQDLGSYQNQLVMAQKEFDEASKHTLPPDKLVKANGVIAKQTAFEHIAVEISQLTQVMTTQKAELTRAQQLANDAALLDDATAQAFKTKQGEVTLAEASLSQLKQYEERATRHATINRAYQAAVVRLQALGEVPVLHPEDSAYNQIRDSVTELRAVVRKGTAIITAFEKDGVVECPTCGTPVTQLDEHLKNVHQEIGMFGQEIEEKAAIIAAIESSRNLLTTYTKNSEAARRQVNDYAAQLKVLVVGDAPKIDRQRQLQIIHDANVLGTKFEAANAAVVKAQSALAVAEAKMKYASERLVELQAAQKLNEVSVELLAKVKVALIAHNNSFGKVESARARVEIAANTVAKIQKELEQLKQKLARGQKTRQFIKRMQTVQTVMHRQALPQQVAQSNLQDMETDLNKNLETFGSPFWVEVTDDLSFTAHPAGKPPHSAMRLSFGQKSVLAMAFRQSLGSLFDAEIGMLCLDEPTAAMDFQNVDFLAEALKQYATKIRGQRQVFVITHAASLLSSFDQCVKIGSLE